MFVKNGLKSHTYKNRTPALFWGLGCLFFFVLFSFNVHAQSFENTLINSSTKSIINPVYAETLEARWDSFISSPSNMAQSDQDLIFSAGSHRKSKINNLDYMWDIGGRYSRLERFQFWAKQAYVSQSWRNFNLSFGRKFFSSLEMDSIWNLGVIETQFRGDPLNPTHQGLSGLFLSHQFSSRLKFKFFVSALSFPNTGTNFDVKNGEVTSDSPWFTGAPSHVEVNGRTVPLTYNLDITNQYEKLFAFSGLMALDWRGESTDIKMNFGYVPSRQWALNITPKGKVDSNNQSQLQVNVNPQLLGRFVGSVGLTKYLQNDFTLNTEFFAESYANDLNEITQEDDMQSDVIESSFAMVGLNKGLSLWNQIPAYISLSYLKRIKEENLSQQEDTIQYSDYNFTDAMSFQAGANYRPLNINFQFKSFYDFSNDSILLSPKLSIQAKKNLNVYSRFDLVGASEESSQDSYLAKQKSNDRFIVGIKYAM